MDSVLSYLRWCKIEEGTEEAAAMSEEPAMLEKPAMLEEPAQGKLFAAGSLVSAHTVVELLTGVKADTKGPGWILEVQLMQSGNLAVSLSLLGREERRRGIHLRAEFTLLSPVPALAAPQGREGRGGGRGITLTLPLVTLLAAHPDVTIVLIKADFSIAED
jgi:hypothetical protein